MGIMKRAPGADRWTGTELHRPWITSWLPSPQGSNLYRFSGEEHRVSVGGGCVAPGDNALDQVPDQTPPGSSILQALPGPPTVVRKPGYVGSQGE